MRDPFPWRSDSGEPRPRLPHGFTATVRGGRPLKRWRYVGVFGPELMLCAGQVRVGPGRQSFWASWDGERLLERTRLLAGHGHVGLGRPGELEIAERQFSAQVSWRECAGVETISRHGGQLIWTRKQAGQAARGTVRLGSRCVALERAAVVVDDSAGYHARRTDWLWCAGVGRAASGESLGWNIVQGVHDAPRASERTLWVDGAPRELSPVPFSADLSGVGELSFAPRATRARRDRLGPFLSDYEQPFGSFSGSLGGIELAEGFGVMERHCARW